MLSFSSKYRQGLLSNLLNAKVGIFYTTFLPQFVEPANSVLAWTSLLVGLHLAVSIVWLAFYTSLVQQVKAALQKPPARRAIDWVTGTALVGIGARVSHDTTR